MSGDDYKTMTTADIRDDFLGFFAGKGCALYPSSPLVPEDPSLLLTNAGMNQFKDIILDNAFFHRDGGKFSHR